MNQHELLEVANRTSWGEEYLSRSRVRVEVQQQVDDLQAKLAEVQYALGKIADKQGRAFWERNKTPEFQAYLKATKENDE